MPRINLEVLDKRVELLLGILILILGAADTDSNEAGDIPDTLGPAEAVQLGIDLDRLGVHFLLGEALDLTDGAGRPLLEGNALEAFVHVQGVITDSVSEIGAAAQPRTEACTNLPLPYEGSAANEQLPHFKTC